MIISAKQCWTNADANHRAYFDKVVKRRLKTSAAELNEWIRIFITEHLEVIRDGSIVEFKGLISQYNIIMQGLDCDEQELATSELKKIFSYDSFSEKSNTHWCAYDLCQTCNISTCPYCNLSFAHTVFKDGEGKVRPSLDHYYDKASYPFLAISINNLVPSCHLCNSSLKGSLNFFTNEHLHPLFDSESIKIELDVSIESHWNIALLKAAPLKITHFANKILAKNSINTFMLNERYKLIEDEARHIAEGLIAPSTLAGGINSRQWVLRGVDEQNYKNRIMGKMIIDLKKQFTEVI